MIHILATEGMSGMSGMSLRVRLRVIGLVLLLVSAVALPAAADSWGGERTCLPQWDLQAKSYGHEVVAHYRDSTLKANWWNSTFKWRTSYHGAGNQLVVIVATTLSSQSAVCVCLQSQCPS